MRDLSKIPNSMKFMLQSRTKFESMNIRCLPCREDKEGRTQLKNMEANYNRDIP